MVIFVTILQLICALLLVAVVLFQSGKSKGLSGTIGGIADSYMAKSKARSLDAKLAKSTKLKEYFNWAVALFGFAAIAVFGLHPILVVITAALYGLFIRGSVVKAVDGHRREAK